MFLHYASVHWVMLNLHLKSWSFSLFGKFLIHKVNYHCWSIRRIADNECHSMNSQVIMIRANLLVCFSLKHLSASDFIWWWLWNCVNLNSRYAWTNISLIVVWKFSIVKMWIAWAVNRSSWAIFKVQVTEMKLNWEWFAVSEMKRIYLFSNELKTNKNESKCMK